VGFKVCCGDSVGVGVVVVRLSGPNVSECLTEFVDFLLVRTFKGMSLEMRLCFEDFGLDS
jgi:hypothetical protein